jgi:hypothetical protein
LLKDGQPFFYLCDTGWDLFVKLDREEADTYLKNRTDKGFNVMDFPGAVQIGILRRLFESRPWQTLEPDQSVVVTGQGLGENHIQSARASDGKFLFVYIPRGNKLTIDVTKVKGSQTTTNWILVSPYSPAALSRIR